MVIEYLISRNKKMYLVTKLRPNPEVLQRAQNILKQNIQNHLNQLNELAKPLNREIAELENLIK